MRIHEKSTQLDIPGMDACIYKYTCVYSCVRGAFLERVEEELLNASPSGDWRPCLEVDICAVSGVYISPEGGAVLPL